MNSRIINLCYVSMSLVLCCNQVHMVIRSHILCCIVSGRSSATAKTIRHFLYILVSKIPFPISNSFTLINFLYSSSINYGAHLSFFLLLFPLSLSIHSTAPPLPASSLHADDSAREAPSSLPHGRPRQGSATAALHRRLPLPARGRGGDGSRARGGAGGRVARRCGRPAAAVRGRPLLHLLRLQARWCSASKVAGLGRGGRGQCDGAPARPLHRQARTATVWTARGGPAASSHKPNRSRRPARWSPRTVPRRRDLPGASRGPPARHQVRAQGQGRSTTARPLLAPAEVAASGRGGLVRRRPHVRLPGSAWPHVVLLPSAARPPGRSWLEQGRGLDDGNGQAAAMELRGWTSSSLLAFSLERWSRTSAGPREARTGAAVRPGQTSRNRCRDFSWIRLLQDGYRMCIQDPVQLTPGHVGSQQPVCTRRAHASATAALSPRSGTALRTFACPVFTSPAIPLGARVMLVYRQPYVRFSYRRFSDSFFCF